MYSYIKGMIAEIEEDNLVLEVNGIGYNIKIPYSVTMQLPSIGEFIKIYTYTCVREDAFILYGFLSKDDLSIFKNLITVSGIGPKGALGILSVMDADALRFAILAGDAKAISKAPGIGAKSAERIIIDLKDKISLYAKEEKDNITASVPKVKAKRTDSDDSVDLVSIEARNEAIEALVSLGYAASDALKAVKNLGDIKGLTTEEILKAALKVII